MLLFRKWVRRLGDSTRAFFSTAYRPEKHYMRGAGPACAARNQPRSLSF
ncbi:hypothetical protein SAMN03080610_01768 [Afifella marina DSM 2698]|uniref:Uncharacterized protein n=1 Tax=Afifella marina DSM 2698 TaxID=1120955 RepID=A0A1G5NBJ6_AFIMA|nr:hypothetical protein SAMN03080610_01768 [Afifella marina DSM 2698]